MGALTTADLDQVFIMTLFGALSAIIVYELFRFILISIGKETILHLEEVYIASLLGLMTVITFAEVVARYGFNYSIKMAHESVVLIFAWLIFIGMSYGVRAKSHIGIDALVSNFSPLWKRYTALLVSILCIVYALIIVYGGYIYVSKIYKVGIYLQDIPIKQWIPRSVIPLGFALLAFRYFEVFINILHGKDLAILGDEAKDALKLKSE